MGLVEIEKKGTVTVNGVSTDEQVAHLGTLGEDNLGSLNLAPTSYEYIPPANRDAGMSYGHIKKEASAIGLAISTTMLIAFIIGFAVLAGYLVMKFGKVNFHIFPQLETYDLKQYNDSLKRCFLILSGMLVGTCILLLVVYNLVVRSRFINNYLSKIGYYVYTIFAVVLNSALFLAVIYCYFLIVNKISDNLRKMLESGVITENVNINTINLFKYAIVILVVIFLVVNCFNIVSIIKEKNRFVFEEEM